MRGQIIFTHAAQQRIEPHLLRGAEVDENDAPLDGHAHVVYRSPLWLDFI